MRIGFPLEGRPGDGRASGRSQAKPRERAAGCLFVVEAMDTARFTDTGE